MSEKDEQQGNEFVGDGWYPAWEPPVVIDGQDDRADAEHNPDTCPECIAGEEHTEEKHDPVTCPACIVEHDPEPCLERINDPEHDPDACPICQRSAEEKAEAEANEALQEEEQFG